MPLIPLFTSGEESSSNSLELTLPSFSFECNGAGNVSSSLPSVSLECNGAGNISLSLPSLSFTAQEPITGELSLTIGAEAANPVKSVIFDIANSWGADSIGVRSIEFYVDGSLIDITDGDYDAYATGYANENLLPDFAFDTELSKTGVITGTSWAVIEDSSQRLICVFNTPISFDEIRVNNYHHVGTGTESGIKDVVVNVSTDEITSTVYDEAISNSLEIFDGTFDKHTPSNVEDEQQITDLPFDASWVARGITMEAENIDIGIFSITLPVLGLNLYESPGDSELTFTGLIFQASGATTYEIDSLEAELPALGATLLSGGSFQEEFPLFQAELSGAVGAIITGEITLPSLETENYSGGVSSFSFFKFNLSSIGNTGHVGKVRCELSDFSFTSFTGGEISASFPELEISIDATPTTIASLSSSFPSLYFLGRASEASEGDIEMSLPRLQGSVDAIFGLTGSMSNTLPCFSFSGGAILEIIGEISGEFKSMWSTGQGMPSGPGAIAILFPALEAIMFAGEVDSDILRYVKERIR